jgi:hypothetical protein
LPKWVRPKDVYPRRDLEAGHEAYHPLPLAFKLTPSFVADRRIPRKGNVGGAGTGVCLARQGLSTCLARVGDHQTCTGCSLSLLCFIAARLPRVRMDTAVLHRYHPPITHQMRPCRFIIISLTLRRLSIHSLLCATLFLLFNPSIPITYLGLSLILLLL